MIRTTTLAALALLLLLAAARCGDAQQAASNASTAGVNGGGGAGSSANNKTAAAAPKPPDKPGASKATLTLNRGRFGGLRRPRDVVADLVGMARRECRAVRAILRGQKPEEEKKDDKAAAAGAEKKGGGGDTAAAKPPSGDCYQSLLLSPLLGTLCQAPTQAKAPPAPVAEKAAGGKGA
jgi:hypothetical protein